ncbi:hypothetical protein SAMN04487934_11110 [Eubacterium ruminantium]|nr:hypothetical protein SAMN04487934_11110 [Eubacterium ruminantium]
MHKLNVINIETYEVANSFFVDIVTKVDEGILEAWTYEEGDEHKELLISKPIDLKADSSEIEAFIDDVNEEIKHFYYWGEVQQEIEDEEESYQNEYPEEQNYDDDEEDDEEANEDDDMYPDVGCIDLDEGSSEDSEYADEYMD